MYNYKHKPINNLSKLFTKLKDFNLKGVAKLSVSKATISKTSLCLANKNLLPEELCYKSLYY